MFTAYHAIMFAVLLIGGAGVIFQASSGKESLTNNPIPVKATESKFDLNTYQVDSRFILGALRAIFMDLITDSTTTVLDPKTTKRKYPEARIIVLDDNFNTFEHVANCLVKIIPGMSKKRAWVLAVEVDREGFAEVWRGPLEQAELYHQQLISKGLTMAPIEKT